MSELNGGQLSAWVCDLAAELRSHGASPGLPEILSAHVALEAIDSGAYVEVRAALRSTLCSSHADLWILESVLAAQEASGQGGPVGEPSVVQLGAPAAMADPSERGDEETIAPVWSEAEIFRHKDFAAYSDEERRAEQNLLRRLALRRPQRLSRRMEPCRRRSAQPDLRQTLRSSVRHGGEPVRPQWRRPSRRSRPVHFLLDISASMEPYARMLLQYVQAAVSARSDVEAFAFGTRLTRLTRDLRADDRDLALTKATEAVTDWGGGTRIGAALAELNRHQKRYLRRSAIVVLLSDGWDLGEPELLNAEMSRLRNCSYRVLWLNPLKADPAYEPLTQGMQAALPHVDRLLVGNSIQSIDEMDAVLDQTT